MKVKAALTMGLSEDFVIGEIDLAEPKETEVLVKIAGCGVCHTDACAKDGQAPGPNLPAVLGHEGSGVVEKVGSAVKGIEPGDHVVLAFPSCGTCEMCRQGHPSCCEHLDDIAFGGILPEGTSRLSKNGKTLSAFFGQSSFAEYAVADQRNVVVVDKDVDIALLGPLGCGIATGAGTVLNALRPGPGDAIAIFGCGGVGLSALMAAKASGCTPIVAIDAVPSRLETAKELGATHVINGKECEDIAAEIKKITEGGADVSVESTGVPALVNTALYCLKRGGTCAEVATTSKPVPIDMQLALMGVQKKLIGVVEGDSLPQEFIPKLIRLYKAGLFPFDKLTEYYKFEDINQAFEDSRSGKTIKPILKMDL